jgi:hypothetical protein
VNYVGPLIGWIVDSGGSYRPVVALKECWLYGAAGLPLSLSLRASRCQHACCLVHTKIQCM